MAVLVQSFVPTSIFNTIVADTFTNTSRSRSSMSVLSQVQSPWCNTDMISSMYVASNSAMMLNF